MENCKEMLKMEVIDLREKLVNLGNVGDHIATEDIENRTDMAVKAESWERLLDELFDKVSDWARENGVEVE